MAERHAGKPCRRRERAARIDDAHAIAGFLRHPRQRLGDVHRTDDDQIERRIEHGEEPAAPFDLRRTRSVGPRRARRREAEGGGIGRRVDQKVFAACQIGGAHDGAAGAARRVQRIEGFALHEIEYSLSQPKFVIARFMRATHLGNPAPKEIGSPGQAGR